MGFKIEESRKLLRLRQVDEAMEYRKSFIPSKIFKYVGLKDDNLDKQKLETLSKESLWLSRINDLNDPFEFQGVTLDRENWNSPYASYEDIDQFFKALRKDWLVSCFTSNVDDCMPMWAHYANNHKGFCIEYTVENKNELYPISYEESKIPIERFLAQLYYHHNCLEDDKYPKARSSTLIILEKLHLLGVIKHKTWEYENEIRFFQLETDDNKGKNIPLKEIGLKTTGIYIGYDCKAHNKELLKEISNGLKINTYQMVLKNENHLFQLEYEII